MTFQHRFKVLLAAGLLLILSACEQFTEFNQNPNEPTEVSADVLFASTVRSAMNTMVTESFLLGNNAAQLTTKTLRTEVDTYNWNAFPTVWEGMYEALTDALAVADQAIESGNEAQEGAAVVWKSWIFATLTNAYGDIPYFNAIAGDEGNFTPVYDSQEAIYADLLDELERATTLLDGSGSIDGDLIFNGDAAKWKKLANSLRLRLLMTAGDKISDSGSQFSSIVASGDIMTSNDDNAVLGYLAGFPNQYPLIPLKTGDFDAVAISEASISVMSQYNDPRLLRYARPDNEDFTTSPEFVGAVNGANSGNCSKVGSRLGVQYWDNPSTTQAADLGLSSADGIVMTYAEVEFLLAEAAAMGWISEDIEEHYRAGIEASMMYHQVDLAPFGWADFADFYANSGVAYSETMDIWEQKWLALFFHGLEPYFEVRRWYLASGSDWDAIPFLNAPCENLNNDNLPMRFLYPGEEQSLNSANYNAAVESLGGNDQNATMWLVD